MDEAAYGSRDEKGHWAPARPPETAPLFVFPPRPAALLKWLPQYFLPYNLLFFASAWAWWLWVMPPAEVIQSFSWPWIAQLFLINLSAVLAWYLAFEWRLYIRRSQGTNFKYNRKFPADKPSKKFWFSSQNLENMLRTLLSGVPIWTACQILALMAFADGWAYRLNWDDNWPWLLLLGLIVPIIHEFHFYCVHRLIHARFLFKWVHSVHHKSVNPSPWSSLAMHPIEHLLYFSSIFYHLLLPSHPLLAIYQLHTAGFGAVPGHVGFDRVEVTKNTAISSHAYLHYLHHKYFEVNYGDGLIPIDKWFGTFHDGTSGSQARMKARLKNRRTGG